MSEESPKNTSEKLPQESTGAKENFAKEIQELEAKGPLNPQENARLKTLKSILPHIKSEKVSSPGPVAVAEEKAPTAADNPPTARDRKSVV